MYADLYNSDAEPHHDASATHAICSDLELFGYRHSESDPDPRDVPEDRLIAGAVSDIFDALVATMADTSLDAWSAPIEWSVKNVSAWSASGLSGQCFPALVDGIPESCAV